MRLLTVSTNLILFAALSMVSVAASRQAGSPVSHAGGGGTLPGGAGRDVVWTDEVNLEGLIASSEVIGLYGLESEIANDFMLEFDDYIDLARWWGGYFRYAPGDPLITSVNLRFFDDAGCVPGSELLEVIIPNNAHETFVYNQGGLFPIYVYYAAGLNFRVVGGERYWFEAQAGDHPFPPQWGRVAAVSIQLCDTVFRSAFFAYPDWTPAIDVFYQAFDASQEFESYGISNPWGACCIDGHCFETWMHTCWGYGGGFAGGDCEPNPCDPVAVLPAAWGRIKALFR
jgi:hypothetical protein